MTHSLNTSIMLHPSQANILTDKMVEHDTTQLRFTDGSTTVTVFLSREAALYCAHLLHAEVHEFDKAKSQQDSVVIATTPVDLDDEIPF